MSPVGPRDPSRTAKDLRLRDAAALTLAASRDLHEAVAITSGWSRRRLLDAALTLALMNVRQVAS